MGRALLESPACAHTVEVLGLRCTDDGAPSFIEADEPSSRWMGKGAFVGSAIDLGGGTDQPQRERTTTVAGTFQALTTTSAFAVIISPEPAAGPALWWAYWLAEQQVEALGETSSLWPQPKGLKVSADGADLFLWDIAEVREGSGRTRKRRSRALLDALQGP